MTSPDRASQPLLNVLSLSLANTQLEQQVRHSSRQKAAAAANRTCSSLANTQLEQQVRQSSSSSSN
jgi:hypothetical protein